MEMYNRFVLQGTGNNYSSKLVEQSSTPNNNNTTPTPFVYQQPPPLYLYNSYPSTATPSLVSSTPSPASSTETGNSVSFNETMYSATGQSALPASENGKQIYTSFGPAVMPNEPIAPATAAAMFTPYNMFMMPPTHHRLGPPHGMFMPSPLQAPLPQTSMANNNAKNYLNVRKPRMPTSNSKPVSLQNGPSKVANSVKTFNKYQQNSKNMVNVLQQPQQHPASKTSLFQQSAPSQSSSLQNSLFADLSDSVKTRAPPGFGKSAESGAMVDSWKNSNIDDLFGEKNGETEFSNLVNGVEEQEDNPYLSNLWSGSDSLFTSSDTRKEDGDRFWSNINGVSSDHVAPSFIDSIAKSFGSLGMDDVMPRGANIQSDGNCALDQRQQPQAVQANLKEYKDRFSETIELLGTSIENTAEGDWRLCEDNLNFFLNLLESNGSPMESNWSCLDVRSLSQLHSLQSKLMEAAKKFSEEKPVLANRLGEMRERFRNMFTVGTVGGPNEDVKMLTQTLTAGWLQEVLQDLSLLNSMKHNSVFLELTQFFAKTIKSMPNKLLGHLSLLNLLDNHDKLDMDQRLEMDDAIQAYEKLIAELDKLRDARHAPPKVEEVETSLECETMAVVDNKSVQPMLSPSLHENITGLKRLDRRFVLNDYYLQLSPEMLTPSGMILTQANVLRNQSVNPASLISDNLEKELSTMFKRKIDLLVDDGEVSCKSFNKLVEILKPRFPQLPSEQLIEAVRRAKFNLAKKNRKQFAFSGFRLKELAKIVEEYVLENGEKPAPITNRAPKAVGTVPWSKVAAVQNQQQPAPQAPAPSQHQQRPTPSSTPLNNGGNFAYGWSSISSTPTGASNQSRSSTPGANKSAVARGGCGGEDGKCDLCSHPLPPMSSAKGCAYTTLCRHSFHATCLETWSKIYRKCPTCERILQS